MLFTTGIYIIGSVTNIKVTSTSSEGTTPLEKVQESLRQRSNRVEQAELQQELFAPGSGPSSPTGPNSPNSGRRRVGSGSGKDAGNKAEQEAVEEEIDRARLSVAIELNKNIVAHCGDYDNEQSQIQTQSDANPDPNPTPALRSDKAPSASGPTRLVVTNLPLTVYSHPSDFMHYATAITSNMTCTCLLVRGTGEEVVTPDG